MEIIDNKTIGPDQACFMIADVIFFVSDYVLHSGSDIYSIVSTVHVGSNCNMRRTRSGLCIVRNVVFVL